MLSSILLFNVSKFFSETFFREGSLPEQSCLEIPLFHNETWEKAQKRWRELKGTWPVTKNMQEGQTKQKSYVYGSPSHLLAGLMRCYCCGGAIVLISGKGNGYYGCYNAKRKTCTNKLLIPRKRLEKAIISELKEKILTRENIEYVYKKLEKLIAKGLNEVPELIKKKNSQYEKLLSEIQNYLNFVKVGNFSKAVSEALKEAERKSDDLKEEIKSLQFQKENSLYIVKEIKYVITEISIVRDSRENLNIVTYLQRLLNYVFSTAPLNVTR